MKIRNAEPRDVEGIVDVHLRSSRAAYADLPAPVLSVSAEARRIGWGEALADPDSRVWIAEDERAVLGFCHLRILGGTAEPGAAEIVSLYVDPARWGEGIGGRLVGEARAAAVASGCRRLVLNVYAENHRARAAYEGMGFTAAPGTVVHARTGLLLKEYGMRIGA